MWRFAGRRVACVVVGGLLLLCWVRGLIFGVPQDVARLSTTAEAFGIRFAAVESLSLACPRESNQREGHPTFAPATRVREPEPGFSTALPVLTKTRVHPCTRPFGPFRLRLTATEGTRRAPRFEASSLLGPVGAPSSGGRRRGKARMSERMDARVRAGHRIPSNAGNGSEADARTPGVLSFGYCFFGQAKKSSSVAEGERKLYISK